LIETAVSAGVVPIHPPMLCFASFKMSKTGSFSGICSEKQTIEPSGLSAGRRSNRCTEAVAGGLPIAVKNDFKPPAAKFCRIKSDKVNYRGITQIRS
jgi:hypothetical protein